MLVSALLFLYWCCFFQSNCYALYVSSQSERSTSDSFRKSNLWSCQRNMYCSLSNSKRFISPSKSKMSDIKMLTVSATTWINLTNTILSRSWSILTCGDRREKMFYFGGDRGWETGSWISSRRVGMRERSRETTVINILFCVVVTQV